VHAPRLQLKWTIGLFLGSVLAPDSSSFRLCTPLQLLKQIAGFKFYTDGAWLLHNHDVFTDPTAVSNEHTASGGWQLKASVLQLLTAMVRR
jgi:hypothetical protein